MDSDNKEELYCDYDGEYHICDKSQTHKKNFRKRQQFNNSTSFSTTNSALDFEKYVSSN